MAHEENGAFYDRLSLHGVSRRDFLKFCGATAAMLGLAESMAPQIAAAVEKAAAQPLAPALWINGGACTGCTESMAQSTQPDIAQIVLDILSLNFIETIMYAQGESAEQAAAQTAEQNAGKFILIYEGTIMEGWDGNALRIAGKPSIETFKELAPKAAAIVAVGSCAVDGGWVRANPNPAEGTGVSEFLAKNNIATPVINLPTCPVNPEWVVAIIIDALLLGGIDQTGKVSPALVAKLDQYGRPSFIFGETIHDNCPRRGHFENGEFVYKFGSPEEAKGYCLYPVGCKGPQTYTNCPIVRWNDSVSWCVGSGAPCIGCGGFNWVDQNTPFLNRFRRISRTEGAWPGPAGFRPETAAYVAGGVVAAGLVVHGIGMAAAGRTKGGAPVEEMKDHDRKKMSKGGGK